MRRIATVLAALAAGLATAPAAHAAPGSHTTAIVAVGDSYMSGEAGRWAGNSNDPATDRDGTDRAYVSPGVYDTSRVYVGGSDADGCHRSDVAEILSNQIRIERKVNLACSGAVTTNVFRSSQGGQAEKGEPPQADQLIPVARQYRIKAIVIAIGGNDLGFSSIVQACLTAYESQSAPCQPSQQPLIDAKFPTAMANVGKAIDEVRAAMSTAGYQRSQYRVVLQSYPSVLPRAAENRYREAGVAPRNAGGCPFYDSDSNWARDSVVSQIASGLKGVAASRGAQFLDLRDAFQGHEFCSVTAEQNTLLVRPFPGEAEWGRFVGASSIAQGQTQELFHPNAYGQQAIGDCLSLLAARTGPAYRCLGGPGVAPGAMRLAAR